VCRVRRQYHFWPAERGFDAWDVERLIELSRGLPVERVRIDSIGEIDTVRFESPVEPDYRGCWPNELPY
jgi:hypothetical protein